MIAPIYKFFLPDSFPYEKNNKQWAVLHYLTDFAFQLKMFKLLWQCYCHYDAFSNPEVFT